MTDALSNIKAHQLIRTMQAARVSPCVECGPVTAASPDDILIHGPATLLGEPTGDGRGIRPGALTWDLENSSVPILWDREDGDHSGMVLGRVDAFVDEGGALLTEARLFASDDPVTIAAVQRVVELIEEGAIGWSVMLDDEEVEVIHREPEITESADGTITAIFRRGDDMQWVTAARVRHLALVDTPAFPSARPALGPLPVNAAATLLAAYPAAHFERWQSDDLVPFQVTPDGRVFGHAAGEGCYRTGSKAGVCKTYSKDPDPTMRNFHTGTVALDNGNVIRVGALTCAGLHASPSMTHNQQRQHHENSTTVWARVVAWNDRKGRLCVSGSVVPGLDEGTLGRVAGLPLSAELWPVPGVNGLTLVGAHSVITPAWPVS